jgi:hypothetical protein
MKAAIVRWGYPASCMQVLLFEGAEMPLMLHCKACHLTCCTRGTTHALHHGTSHGFPHSHPHKTPPVCQYSVQISTRQLKLELLPIQE